MDQQDDLPETEDSESFSEYPLLFVFGLGFGCLVGVAVFSLLGTIAWFLSLYHTPDLAWEIPLLAANAVWAKYLQRLNSPPPDAFTRCVQMGAIFSVCGLSFLYGPAFGALMLMAAAVGSLIGIAIVGIGKPKQPEKA